MLLLFEFQIRNYYLTINMDWATVRCVEISISSEHHGVWRNNEQWLICLKKFHSNYVYLSIALKLCLSSSILCEHISFLSHLQSGICEWKNKNIQNLVFQNKALWNVKILFESNSWKIRYCISPLSHLQLNFQPIFLYTCCCIHYYIIR